MHTSTKFISTWGNIVSFSLQRITLGDGVRTVIIS